ncbi:MAG: ECF-type sigma factor [Gemmatimonadota bacterium]
MQLSGCTWRRRAAGSHPCVPPANLHSLHDRPAPHNQPPAAARRLGRDAVDLLFERLHSELRAIAANRLGAEPSDHTRSATALVNEAYLKLVNLDRKE